LDFNKATDGRVAAALVGIYANHLHFAPDSTMPASHHSIFTG